MIHARDYQHGAFKGHGAGSPEGVRRWMEPATRIALAIHLLLEAVRLRGRIRAAPTHRPAPRSDDAVPRVVFVAPPDVTDVAIVSGLCRAWVCIVDTSHLVLDFSRVQHADTKVIAAIVLVLRHARRRGTSVSLRPSPELERWLGVHRLSHLLTRAPTFPDAPSPLGHEPHG
jgi:ABC-type transporter Mla MlaB component